MNRTPRSARRRASRQLDANDPSPGCAPYIRRCFLDPCQLLDQSRDSGFERASVRAVVLDGSHRSNSAAAWAAGSFSGNPTYPANLCLFSGWIEFAGFREDFGETVGEAVQAAARSAVRQVASEHLHYVLSGQQRVDYTVQAGAGGSEVRFRLGCQVPRLRAGLMKLALQIRQSNLEIQHGHLGRGVTEQLHDRNKLYAGTKHLSGIGVTKLVRNDALRNACLGTYRMQVSADFTDQGFPGAGAGQQPAISGQRIERTEEAETLDQLTHEGVYGDHPFGLQLAERHVNRPVIGTGGVEAIEGKVGRFADAHAGVAN